MSRVNRKYNLGNPYKKPRALGGKQFYPRNTPLDANHGYQALAKDKDFANKFNSSADKAGVPGQWLADVVAFHTGGTFRPETRDFDKDAVGMLQMNEQEAQSVGTNTTQLEKMDAMEQLDKVSEFIGQHRNKMKSIDDLFSLSLGGEELLNKSEPEREKTSDDSASYTEYAQLLGNHVGRRYRLRSDRGKDSEQEIHTQQVEGCSICTQMLETTDSIVPHYRHD
jgi:hypothetical protein